MKYIFSFSFIAFLTLLECGVYAEEVNKGKTIMTGFVLNQDGEPVVGAQIHLENYFSDSGDVVFSGVTDEKGHYMIPVNGTKDDMIAVISAEGYPEYRFHEKPLSFSQGSMAQNFCICNAAIYSAGQLATIFQPTAPDATLGQYYRLDRVEDRHLMFEREQNPKADVPYLIIPDRDFRISYADMKVTEKWVEQSFDEASFYGFYTPTTYGRYENEMTQLIDKTTDCDYIYGKHSSWESGARIGAFRALMTLKSAGGWTDIDVATHTINDDWRDIVVFHDGTTDNTFTYKEVIVPVAQPSHSAFAGIVSDNDRQPIANAKIRLRDADGHTAYEAVTDSYGHFLLSVEDSRKPYELSIVAEGYPEQWQYRDGWQPFDFSKGSLAGSFHLSNKAVFTTGQLGSIILPTEPDPSLGDFYRLEGVEEGKIVFCQETRPQANYPYLIVPGKDFEVDYSAMDLPEQAEESAVQGISLRGFYGKHAVKRAESEYTVLPDKTPDCDYVFAGEHSSIDVGCTVGAMHAVLVIDSSVFKGLHEFVSKHSPALYDRWIIETSLEFRDTADRVVFNGGSNGIASLESSSRASSPIYDLQGRRLSATPQRGMYIRDGQKYVVK